MRALHRYFLNPFDARDISLDELMAFATDHFQRMRANNADGWLDARIAATEASLAETDAATSGDVIGGAKRKARKMSKRRFRRERLPDASARIHAYMMAHFGPRSPQLKELGRRRDLQRCPDDSLDNLLRAMHRAVAAHEAVVGTEPVALAAELVAEWAGIYQQSEGATGTKVRTASLLRQARRRLQWDLYLNLLSLVERYPRQPDKLRLYMQPHLLRNRRRREAADETGPEAG